MDFFDKSFIENIINQGADVKMLQYDTQVDEKSKSVDRINLPAIMQTQFCDEIKAPLSNCVLINIDKDVDRYTSSVQELNKLSITNFVHLKATYWKNRKTLESDMTFVLNFLHHFNPNVKTEEIKINMFSELNDNNIYIQDGPLACWCSHLRAMIYGYLNFNKYTIVSEDDISVVNTKLIEEYMSCIPNDWDIICMNAIPKNMSHVDSFYKFANAFHSTHMYIIKNEIMPELFKHFYPIVDQVDVLISNTQNIFNIYNLPNTIYQKSVSTNTQNNLHVIFTSPNYANIKSQFDTVNRLLLFFANIILPNNSYNSTIVTNLIFDVLCGCISNIYDIDMSKSLEEMPPCSQYKSYVEYTQLLCCICYIIQCTKKGVSVRTIATSLLDSMIDTLICFKLHNTIIDDDCAKAHSFGSTSHTYILKKNNTYIKQYNESLKWKTKDHDDINNIFLKELDILKNQSHIELLSYDADNKLIKMSYRGISLYNSFDLPHDWRYQIIKIFDALTKSKIYYPEFRLQNILNDCGRLSFVDFGLAKICADVDNVKNCEIFIELLSILEKRLHDTTNIENYLLYDTFINGIKLHRVTKYLDNVF